MPIDFIAKNSPSLTAAPQFTIDLPSSADGAIQGLLRSTGSLFVFRAALLYTPPLEMHDVANL